MVHEELGGYCTPGAQTKETFVNDNSKASDRTHPTDLPNLDEVSDTPPSAARPAVGGDWKPLEGDALQSLLFTPNPSFYRPSVRLTALAVPATFLAAQTTTQDTSVGNILTTLLTGLGHAGGTLLTQQPLLTVAMTVGLVGAGYLKLRADIGPGRENDGFAPKRKLRKTMGRHSLVRDRKVLRPSLAKIPARRVDTHEVGTYLGQDRKTGLHLYMRIEDSSVMVAPPGSGKTAKLANWIIDAPGAVLATSVKPDIIALTQELRARVGRILIWDPYNVSDQGSNIAWDPVIGCADPQFGIKRCMDRANALLDGSDGTKGMENRSFWEMSSYKVLKAFLWAAAADNLTLIDVARWSKSYENQEAIEILEKYEHPDPFDATRPVAPRGWRDDLLQVQRVKGKPTTGENVFGTLSQTFSFLDSPQVQKVIEGAHGPDASFFDIKEYLTSQDTLYLLGRDSGRGGIGPLFSCLTSEIYEVARELAPRFPKGRLDAPWSLILDEAALICSVPLEKWTADARGLGIVIHAVFQSRSQIRERYGREAAKTIWTNMVKLILGGLADEEDLEGISKLCGRHQERRESHSTTPGPDGTTRESVSYTYVEVDTMTPSDIMYLEPGEILVLRRNAGGPVVVKYVPVWERKDIKDLAAAAEKAEKLAAREQKRTARAAKKGAKQKAAVRVGWPPVEDPVVEETASLWEPPRPEGPWAPPAPDYSPWTADPAASGWSNGPLPGPRDHLQVVRGEVVPQPSARPPLPPLPKEPPAAPPMPDFAPTQYLEVPAQPKPETKAEPAAPVPLRKTGTDDTADADPYGDDGWGDDDQGGF